MKDFQVIEHTADVGIIARGKDLKETFANAARGLFSLMVDSREIVEERCCNVEVTATDREALLVEWLNELIYLFDVENLVFNRFEIVRLTDTALTASCYGQKVVPGLHRIKMGVKATTYHMLKIEEGNGFRAQVLFDI
ncbi:MAG: archease [Dehalococcoidia bacterium]